MQNDSIDNLRLDLNKKSVRGVFYVRVGDTRARTIHITLVSNGTVVDLSDAYICELLIHKPDGSENDQAMVRVGNELQYTLRTQDINVPGECKCQVMVTFNDSAVVTSPEFSIMVYQKDVDQELERSTNEYTAISQELADAIALGNQVSQDADRAEAARENIETYEELCRQHEENAAESETNAFNSATSASESADSAAGDKALAKEYRDDAETYMEETRSNLAAVEEKASEILGYDSSAKESAEDAADSAEAAHNSELAALASETAAGNSAEDSEAYAVGTRDSVDVPDTDPAYHNNSKYWSEQSQALGEAQAEEAEAWAKGTKNGTDVPATAPQYHDNAKYYAEHARDDAHEEATNAEAWAVGQRDGTDVPSTDETYNNNAKYWAGQAQSMSHGVASNISYDNTTSGLTGDDVQEAIDELSSEKTDENPTFTEASTRANIASGESFATILGKIKKWFTDLKDLAFIAKDGTSSTKYLRGDGTWQPFPTIPAEQIQSDWNQTTNTAKDYIKNKPTSLPANGGTADNVSLPRVAESCNNLPSVGISRMREYTSGENYNLPSNNFYHILESRSQDTNWGTQLALGMTDGAVYYRRYAGGSWQSWSRLAYEGELPTVNNATLTIQKNGTTVETFTANASSDVTCNIEVPTNTNQLTNGANFITSGDIFSTAEVTDANNAPIGFSTIAGGQANSPYPFWTTLITTVFSATSYKQQIALPWAYAESQIIAVRRCDGGTWSSWYYIGNSASTSNANASSLVYWDNSVSKPYVNIDGVKHHFNIID